MTKDSRKMIPVEHKLHRKVKVTATLLGVTVKAFVESALLRELDRSKPASEDRHGDGIDRVLNRE